MEDIVLYNIIIIIVACVISIILEMMILPRIIYISKKKRLFDLPSERKKHTLPIPRLAGTSFTPTILLVAFFSIFVRLKFDFITEAEVLKQAAEVTLLVAGLLIIYFLGVKDDLVGVDFRKKFVVQFFASFCIIGSGVYVNNLYGIFGIYEIPDWIGIFLSVGFIVFTTNAINLIDGTDGLASGISCVALALYGMLLSIYGLWTYAGISFITIGILIPFFYYNFFHSTRKVFMGDAGSLTLGYLLSFMALRLAKYPPTIDVVSSGFLLLVISPLFIPLFDAAKVMFVRISMGKGPFSPDRNHIHHKLIDLGFSNRKTTFVLILSSVILVILNWLLLSSSLNCNIIFLINTLLAVLINSFIYRKIRVKGNRNIADEQSEFVDESVSEEQLEVVD
jgi:UDP-N-acetylmuramyl pentapeptide phosphotransferase/UDP-N-acetylglucosamine-1-phosphate transferase